MKEIPCGYKRHALSQGLSNDLEKKNILTLVRCYRRHALSHGLSNDLEKKNILTLVRCYRGHALSHGLSNDLEKKNILMLARCYRRHALCTITWAIKWLGKEKHINVDLGLGLWCLTPLPTIFQLQICILWHNVVSSTPRHERGSNSQF